MQLYQNNIEDKKPLAEVSENLLRALHAIRGNNGRYVFLGSYPELPAYYAGSDIDILVNDIEIALQAFLSAGFVVRRHEKFEFRAFRFCGSQRYWIVIDVETTESYPSLDRRILHYCLDYAAKARVSQLYIAPTEGLLAYKTAKYLINGFVHSEHQIINLQEAWKDSPDNVREKARSLLGIESLEEPTRMWVGKLSSCRFGTKSEPLISKDLKDYIIDRRKKRHARRVVFQGTIQKKGLFRSPRMVAAFLWTLLSSKGANPWPAIAIVGNDGSGKSEICQRLKDRLYKIDPLHIVMRGNAAWLPGWNRIQKPYKRWMRKFRAQALLSPLAWVGAWLGEIVDFLDKFLRYKVGMAWAKAGFGFVLFERYSTDRLRGEYPGPKWSLFPLEQFFPFPDAVILLDVTEEDSLKRKPADGHSYQEMHEKRQNYLRLINEIEPHFVIPAGLSLDEVELRISEIIWNLAFKMQSSDRNQRSYRAVWSPAKRQHDGSYKKRKQKNGFF